MRRAVHAVLLATILIGSSLGAQNPIKFRLVGYARDAESGAGIVTAIARFPDLRRVAVADSTGRFVFDNFPVGTHKFEIGRIGYVTVAGSLTIDTSSTLSARLIPQPILLKGIVAAVSRLEGRRRAAPYSVLAYKTEALANADGTVLDFLQRLNGTFVSCRAPDGTITWCVLSRGALVQITLVVNENPIPNGGDMLEMYFPDEFAEVEFLPSLGMIRAYTPAFLELVARKQVRLAPFLWVPQGLKVSR